MVRLCLYFEDRTNRLAGVMDDSRTVGRGELPIADLRKTPGITDLDFG